MDNMHLVTGYSGREHITAVDQAAFNAALIGTGQFVLDKGKVFEAQVVSNNLVRVLDGELMMQGRFVRLNPDTYVDLAIENGAQGMKRNDLVVARYTKDTVTGVEDVNLVVIKGTAVASNPVDPAHTESDITNGSAVLHDYPLWRIPLDGLNVGNPVCLFGDAFMDSMRTLPVIRQQVLNIHAEVDAQLAEQDAEMDAKIAGIVSYTKAEVLTDEVKEKFGLAATAVPNNIFEYLNKYSQHWWEKYSTVDGYVAVQGSNAPNYIASSDPAEGSVVEYGDSITIDSATGAMSLSGNVGSITYNYYTVGAGAVAEAIFGKYIYSHKLSGFYYVAPDSTHKSLTSDGDYWMQIWCYPVSAVLVTGKSLVGHVHDIDSSAYPENGEQGGFLYKYIGIPFDNAATAPKIATGSYVGTGTYGSDNPNSLTFDFPPQLVIIMATHPTVFLANQTEVATWSGISASGGYGLAFTVNENTVSWCMNEAKTWYGSGSSSSAATGGNAEDQLNVAGQIYQYLAIG